MCTLWRYPLMVAFLVSAVTQAAFAPASVAADAGPLPPVVIVPVTPVELEIPAIVSTVGGSSGRSRGGLIWSTTGRADVDVDMDRRHGRVVFP